jgi:hypothetical protein
VFCDEKILKVYMGVVEYDDVYSHNAFLDCYHDIAYHCTDGYRLVLETENFAISLCKNGVVKQDKNELFEQDGEWLQNGIEFFEDGEAPWVHFETTLFVGERLLSVTKESEIYLLKFDDFVLKIIPHENGDSIDGLHNQEHWSFNNVLGCDRHLKRKCPYCNGDGEILLDFVSDYIVRCKECKKSTWAGMNLIDAITDWNNGELNYMVDEITIE